MKSEWPSRCNAFAIARFLVYYVLLIVAALPSKHHARVNLTEIRLQQAKQRQQLIKNVCRRLNESQDIDWPRLFIDDQRKYIYCPVPKAACSSWKLTLLQLICKDLSNVTNIHVWRMTDNILKRAVHYNATQMETRLKNYFKFVFVREPLERLVSAYLDKCFRDPNYGWLSPAIKKRRRLRNSEHQGETTKHYRYVVC